MFSASRLLLQLSLLVASSASAVDYSTTVKTGLGEALAPIPPKVTKIQIPELKRVGGQSYGNSREAQRFQQFQAGQASASGQMPSFQQTTREKEVTHPDYAKMREVVQDVQVGVSTSTDFKTANVALGNSEQKFQGYNIQPGSLTKITSGDSAGGAGTGHTDAAANSLSSEQQFKAFQSAASTITQTMASDFGKFAESPPEVKAAQEAAEKKFEQDQINAQNEMNRAAAAQAANANKNGGGGGGSGGGGGGGGGGGLEAPKVPEGGRGIASFDPSKIQSPKAGNEVASALLNAVSSSESGGNADNGPLINPVTMSGGGFPQQSQNGDSKMLADTNSEKGFKLGGPKSVPQTLTAAAGAFPANNAQNGGAGGTPALGGGKGTGGDATSGDPYANVGKEAPYKSVNYNLVKDAGYGSASGGGEEGGGEGGGEKDGEVDGGNAEAKEMISNITRPGQFLPAAGNADTGYPGIFAYRGYIRKVCNLQGSREQVALCKRPINFAQKPATPSSQEPESFIASVQKQP